MALESTLKTEIFLIHLIKEVINILNNFENINKFCQRSNERGFAKLGTSNKQRSSGRSGQFQIGTYFLNTERQYEDGRFRESMDIFSRERKLGEFESSHCNTSVRTKSCWNLNELGTSTFSKYSIVINFGQ
jgi:hypothetical protein